jgi:hypothetical protein
LGSAVQRRSLDETIGQTVSFIATIVKRMFLMTDTNTVVQRRSRRSKKKKRRKKKDPVRKGIGKLFDKLADAFIDRGVDALTESENENEDESASAYDGRPPSVSNELEFTRIREILNDIIFFINTMVKRMFLLNDDMTRRQETETVKEEFDFLDALDEEVQKDKEAQEKEGMSQAPVYDGKRYNYV